jgi:hypothetical protein
MPDFNDFLSRIRTDYAFYFKFRQSAEEALADYDLSAEQRAALSESGGKLLAQLGQIVFSLAATKNVVALGSVELKFNSAEAIVRPEVQQTVARIRDAGKDSQRFRV